ncbi:hypothetical protein NKDENANG_01524 [Candidatus Entotheonellaceae bacterium PAL068K]
MAREKAIVRQMGTTLEPVRPAAEESRGPSDLQLAIRDLKRRPPALFGLPVMIMVVLLAALPGVFAPQDSGPVAQRA